MATFIDATWGMWLISVFLETLLFGVGILQSWLYFQWYPKDPVGTKAMIVVLCVLETTQLALLLRATYWYLVTSIGSPQNLASLIWEDRIQLLLIYLAAFIVQGYYTHTLWILNKRQRKGLWVTLLIGVLALTSLGAGLAQTVLVFRVNLWSQLDDTKIVTSIQSGTTLACDVAITISLCFTLHTGRRGISVEPANKIVNKLIIYSVNRGILTSVCAALNLILFLALPGTFWFLLGLISSSKLYMNSVLATLNTREYVRSTAVTNNSIALSSATTFPSFAQNPRWEAAKNALSHVTGRNGTHEELGVSELEYKASAI